MYKVKFISVAVMLATATTAFAGGILTNTNQSVNFLRNPARDAAIGLDGVYSNPAGVAFLSDGLHLGFNWQYAKQTRTITSTNPLFALGAKNNGLTTKEFKGVANAPFIPSLQAAYNKNNWSFQFNFSVPGGGGKCEFDKGIGSFETVVGAIANKLIATSNQLNGALGQFGASVPNVTGYDVDGYMKGQQFYFGFQLGAARKINEHLSVYAGLRLLYGTASYEARRFGVHSAQSIKVAKRLCPQLIIVEPHFQRYKEVSMQLREIFHDYTDMIEPISLDEAFLDVTENKKGMEMAVDIAREIKQRIRETTGLTASAGVSYCKSLAKIASDWRKPDGLTVIHPDRALDFIAQLKVEKIWGVGEKTAEKMHRMGIFTGLDLRNMSLKRLTQEYGKMGQVFYDFSRGIDNRPVISEWERKSVSCERTFETDISDNAAVTIHLYHTVLELVRRIEKNDFEGRTLTLKVKFLDFQQITRSVTADHILRTKDDILPLAKQLMQNVEFHSHPVRLLGLGVSNQKGTTQQKEQLCEELELEFQPWPDEY